MLRNGGGYAGPGAVRVETDRPLTLAARAIDASTGYGYYVHMNAGTAELRNHLSHFLQQVRRGVRVVVLDRGRPVAQLVPFASEGALGDRIASLAEEGIVTVDPERKRARFKPIPLHGRNVLVSRVVDEMRDER